MRGRNKCKILKQIRQKIAEENDIPYVTRACSYQGECSGTCPRCEAELRYLEQQLAHRQALGKAVTVAALTASLSLGAVGCVPAEVNGMLETEPAATAVTEVPTEETQTATAFVPDDLKGEVAVQPDSTMGMLPLPEPTEELTGDVAWDPAEMPTLPGGAWLGPDAEPPTEETPPVETITPEPAAGDATDAG